MNGNSTYNTSGFIPVEQNQTYTYTYGTPVGIDRNMPFLAAFDSNKNLISTAGTKNVSKYTVPNQVAFIRISCLASNFNKDNPTVMLYKGTTIDKYYPYYSFTTVKNSALDLDTTLLRDGAPADAGAVGKALENININTDKTLTESDKPADAKVVGDNISDLKSALNDATAGITAKLTKIESNNYAKSDSDVTAGYVSKDGAVVSTTSYWYTDKIPVAEGDEVRIYAFEYGAFTVKYMRFVCAYNSENQAVSASGTENVSVYTVPSGVTSIVITSSGTAENVTQLMITRNYVATVYEPYFVPYYIASEDFVKNVLDNYEIPEVSVDGYNLIKIAENGVGAYYASGNTLTFNASYDSYHYAIIPVEKNSRYYVSISPRWWVLTDDDNNVLASGVGFNPYTKRYIDTGNATKFYYTIDNGTWNNETTYGVRFAIIVSKSNTGSGSCDNVRKPEWLNGLSQRMCDSKYAFAFNRARLKFTKNANKKFYFKNLLALDSNYAYVGIDAMSIEGITKDYISITYTSVGEKSMVGYVYDVNLSLVEQQSDIKVGVADDNLSNCSALVIGDSTVEQNIMTQKMLDAFTAKNKTLTLLGTRGTAPNLHEGRSGWSAKQYCTQSTDNPFYNNGFDFSHYMTAQEYSAVDFVVLQIGINDLYNVNLADSDDKIVETMGYVCSMIDSILAWNASQKIIINLPTPVNPNYTGDYMYVKRNVFVRYNAQMLLEITKYNIANVRPSDTFVILDPESDISDNVHPTTVGYEKMANEVVNQINCWQNNV